MRRWLCGKIGRNQSGDAMRNDLLSGEWAEQFFDDVLLAQLGLDVIEGEIAQAREPNLRRCQ